MALAQAQPQGSSTLEGPYTHNMYDAQPGARRPPPPLSGEYEQAH